MRKLANHAARDIASPAVKMGNRSLFPGVAVPLAFFCTLFFRHRKKSVSAPWDGQSQSAPESARHSPPWGISDGKVVAYQCKQGAFRSPPAPLRTVVGEKTHKGVPRGKQSARFALPCVPLVVCLNDRALTAFGGCIHWMTVNFSNLI